MRTKLAHRHNQRNMAAQEAPSTKLQAPEKNQTSNSKTERVRVSKFDAWSFSGLCRAGGSLATDRAITLERLRLADSMGASAPQAGAWCLVLGALGPVRFHWKRRGTRNLLLPAIFLVGGCAHSPTVDVVGSYFPAWMLCIIFGLVSTLIGRLLLVGFGIYAHLRLKPLIFSCTAIFFTLAVWLVFFKS